MVVIWALTDSDSDDMLFPESDRLASHEADDSIRRLKQELDGGQVSVESRQLVGRCLVAEKHLHTFVYTCVMAYRKGPGHSPSGMVMVIIVIARSWTMTKVPLVGMARLV